MELETNHPVRDIVTKLLDLFSDISYKGITGPLPNVISYFCIGRHCVFLGQHNGWPEGLPARAVGRYLSHQRPLLGGFYCQCRHPLYLLRLPVHLLSDLFILQREWNRPLIKGEGIGGHW